MADIYYIIPHFLVYKGLCNGNSVNRPHYSVRYSTETVLAPRDSPCRVNPVLTLQGVADSIWRTQASVSGKWPGVSGNWKLA